jgi:hypothetical protein
MSSREIPTRLATVRRSGGALYVSLTDEFRQLGAKLGTSVWIKLVGEEIIIKKRSDGN